MILFFGPETRVSDQRLHHSTTRQQTTLTTKNQVASSITIDQPSPIEISEPLSHAALRLPCLACGRSHQRSSCQVAAASTQLLATLPHCCTTTLCPVSGVCSAAGTVVWEVKRVAATLFGQRSTSGGCQCSCKQANCKRLLPFHSNHSTIQRWLPMTHWNYFTKHVFLSSPSPNSSTPSSTTLKQLLPLGAVLGINCLPWSGAHKTLNLLK